MLFVLLITKCQPAAIIDIRNLRRKYSKCQESFNYEFSYSVPYKRIMHIIFSANQSLSWTTHICLSTYAHILHYLM
jgi:hypothetical protein